MRIIGRRTKKLIVAFHFQLGNQVAWNCDSCRKSGLEVTRRCGWHPAAKGQRQQVVWVRNQAACGECPVSYITAVSQYLLEGFHAWKLFGRSDYRELSARLVEAYFVLEGEWRKELRNAQT